MWRQIEHTGDLALEVRARTLPELFAESLAAFTSVLTDGESVEARVTRRVTVEAPERDLLLADWLSELLVLFEVDKLVFRSAQVSLEREGARVVLVADLQGETYDPERHPPRLLVKAVTYHALELVEDADGFVARVVLDI